MKLNRTILFAIMILCLSLSGFDAEGKEVAFGDLKIELPDSMNKMEVDGPVYAATDGQNLTLSISAINMDGKDASKVKEKGDWLTYPFLKKCTLVGEETESWHDWSRKFVKHSYVYDDNGKERKAYTYHADANGYRYIIFMTPYTEAGEQMAADIMDNGVKTEGWYSNAPFWWSILFVVLLLVMLFAIDPDNSYEFGRHFSFAIVSMIVFTAIILFTTRLNFQFVTTPLLIALGIVVLTPPLRKPISWVLENAGD